MFPKLFRHKTSATRVLLSEPIEAPDALTAGDLNRLPKTTLIMAKPEVLTGFICKASQRAHNEIGSLLIGRVDGKFLVVEGAVPAERVGSRTNITFSPRDFEKASSQLKEGQIIVGWAHSHPRFGVFLSPTDVRFQTQGQGLFPDWTGLVVDPFRPDGFHIGFYRVQGGQAVRIPHHYFVEEDHEA